MNNAFKVMDDPRIDPFIKPKPVLWPRVLEYLQFKQLPVAQPKPIINELLDCGSRILFGGGSKTFKTWLQCDLAISIACGAPWLGFQTHQVVVLYVNFELKDYYIKKRLVDIQHARQLNVARDFFHVWNLRQFSLERNQFAEELLRLCQSLGVRIVFLDPFYKLLTDNEEENSQKDMRIALHCLNPINSADISTSLGMHFSKGNQANKDPEDRISGAGTIVRDADSVLTLTKHKEAHAFTLDFIIRDHPPVDSFVIQWQAPIMVRTELNPKDIKRIGDGCSKTFSREDLLELIRHFDDEFTVSQMCEKASEQLGFSRATFYRFYAELKKSNEVFVSKVANRLNVKSTR